MAFIVNIRLSVTVMTVVMAVMIMLLVAGSRRTLPVPMLSGGLKPGQADEQQNESGNAK